MDISQSTQTQVESVSKSYVDDANDRSQYSNTTSNSEDEYNFCISSENSDYNLPDKSGNVPLHTAILQNDVKTLNYILQQENIDLDIRNRDESTPLYLSISQMRSESLAIRLIEAGCDINVVNRFEATPLHSTIIAGEMDSIVHELIKRGADVNAQDDDDGTPLHYAIEGGDDVEALCMLLYYGADVNIVDKEKRTPFTYALFDGQLEPAKVLFDYYDEFDNRDDDGYTALHLASLCDSSLTLKMLEAGADVNCITKDGCNVLEFSLLDDNATTFKSIWSRMDYQTLLQCAVPLLYSFARSWNHYQASEWVECMYLVLDCPIALDLIEHCNKYLDRMNNNYSFFQELLFTFHTLSVQENHRITIISICLTLGAEIYNIFDLDSAIKFYGFGQELETLIYMTNSFPSELDNRNVIVHPLLPLVLAAEDFETDVVFESCKKQVENFREESLLAEQMNVIISSLGFFSLPHYMKQELLQWCESRVHNCCKISEKLDVIPDLPSLQELSRNQAHKFIRQSCGVTKPYHFQDAVKNLKLPRFIQDIIRFKRPLYE